MNVSSWLDRKSKKESVNVAGSLTRTQRKERRKRLYTNVKFESRPGDRKTGTTMMSRLDLRDKLLTEFQVEELRQGL